MGGTHLTKTSPPFIRFLTGYLVWALQGIAVRISPNGLMRPPWKSANDLLLACFDVGYLGQQPTAVYLDGSAKAESSIESIDERKQKALWADSVRLVGLKDGETALASLL